jgi:predicted dehydrogenase
VTRPVRWGVLGAAKIAVEKVIPAMRSLDSAEVTAIASRELERARSTAIRLGVPKAYGSYEELLNDEEVDVIYNPLPNDLHVVWSIKAAEAGKHVLCEKPIGLDLDEARQLLDARDRTGVKIQEAFMVRTHPQWVATRELIRSGRLGELRSADCVFSYFNRDASNIRNQASAGGGALMDIGCYPINLSRFVFDAEPKSVFGLIERDPDFDIDRMVTGVLDFGGTRSTFTCATQAAPYQRMLFLCTGGWIEVEIPVNAPSDHPTRIRIGDSAGASGLQVQMREFPTCDQYTIQADHFSRAVRGECDVAIPLEDALKNMAVIDAVRRSAKSGQWEAPAI